MSRLSRRSFMQKSGMTVAAAAVAIPGLPALVSTTSAEAPEVEGDTGGVVGETASATSGSSAGLSQPLVAQVKNAATGEISIYSGEQEITYQDRAMAARLVQAAAANH